MSFNQQKRPFSGPDDCQVEQKRLFLGPNNDQVDQSVEKDNDKIRCTICDRTFSANGNLNKHMRKFHPASTPKQQKNQVCPICEERYRKISDLQNHIMNEHEGINLKFEKQLFYCENDFQEWKKKVELESNSFFLKERGAIKRGEKMITTYVCNRNGRKNPKKDDRERHIKSGESIKLDKTCPAIMTVSIEKVHEATEIEVNFQSVHVGHKAEPGKLRLPKDDRNQLASMLDVGVPVPKVLDYVQEQYSPSKRLGLVIKKDLHNISRDYGLNSNVILHKDDATSVDIRVKKMMKEDSNPILLYKPVGENLKDYPNIQNDEFLLGIMNDAQAKLLELNGGSCVMIDSTHGLNQYGFELTTMMVHDENHEGFPVAIFYSSRTASETFVPFFAEIKNRLPNLQTNIFMSDDTNSYYNAWKTVFKDKSKHLLCAWHIKKNWAANLNAKVKDLNQRQLMKADLNSLMHEVDITTFEKLIEEFFFKYESEEKFLKYFEKEYVARKEMWAYCFRIGCGVNTNMKLERWHRQIKYEEAGGRIIKRLDKSLSIVLGAIAKKQMGRLISIERSKLTARVALIRKRHKSSLILAENYTVLEMIPKETWMVMKTVDSTIVSYTINYVQINCGCGIRCDDCNICIHQCTCTCVDYCIRFQICKHIHYVCQNFDIETCCDTQTSSSEGMLAIDVSEAALKRQDEKTAIVKEMSKTRPSNLECRKSTLIAQLQGLQAKVLQMQSNDKLKFIEDSIKNIDAYLATEPSHILPTISNNLKKAPSNKYVEPQKRLSFNLKPKKKILKKNN